MKYYSKIGRALGGRENAEGRRPGSPLEEQRFLLGSISDAHKGRRSFITHFNFPAWGLCEKAAPALLSGVPIVVKPASPTAWLTHRMVEDIVKGYLAARSDFHHLRFRSRPIGPRRERGRRFLYRLRDTPRAFVPLRMSCAVPSA